MMSLLLEDRIEEPTTTTRPFQRGGGIMKSIRKSFRRRKKAPTTVTEQKPQEWIDDERKVRDGICEFRVKYLGAAEVAEARGIHHCEEAVKRHKLRRQRNKTRALLVISPDTIRLIKEKTKQLIIDQSIEKISFCAPDGTYERAFSYICRDGATKRWMCYSFSAICDAGERLSHAFGAAFRACLERKQAIQVADTKIKNPAEETSFTAEQPSVQSQAVSVNAEINSPECEPPYCEPPKPESSSSEESKEDKKDENKLVFEIKSLPRPQAPEELKYQPSFKLFVPSRDAFKSSSLREDKLQINVEKFRGHPVLNPVPEIEPEMSKPVQAVQPFIRNISSSQSVQVMRQHRRAAEPIREVNPWTSTLDSPRNEEHSSFVTAFPPSPAPSAKKEDRKIQQIQPPVDVSDCPGDKWIQSIAKEVIPQLRTGESGASMGMSSPRMGSKIPPAIPARTGFNRFNSSYMSQRLPNSHSAPTGHFHRSQSLRYTGSAGVSSTSSSPNPFQDAPFPDFTAQWEALGQKQSQHSNSPQKPGAPFIYLNL